MGTAMKLDETTALRDFLAAAEAQALTTTECVAIIDHAEILLENFYVHLAQKRSLHAIDPVQRLRTLRHRLLHAFKATHGWSFHEEMLTIFTDLRDLHTRYLPPPPYQGKVAFLPLLIEEYDEGGERRYMVSKLLPGNGAQDFIPGARVTSWNGIPIDLAVTRNAARQGGSNPDARHARGLEALTVRPLAMTFPPDEDWVVIGYEGASGPAELRLQWRVADWETFRRASRGGPEVEDARGLDGQSEVVRNFKRALARPGHAADHDEGDEGDEGVEGLQGLEGLDEGLERFAAGDAGPSATTLPGNFAFRTVKTPDGEFGYLRIWSFENPGGVKKFQDTFVQEFIRILELLPQNGLILDVRANPGGLIPAGERLLQLLTPRKIEPARLQFVSSAAVHQLCKAGPEGLQLDHWKSSLARAIETGATFSQAYPFLPYASAYNTIGQRYHGPVVLIVDALCYSTTDVFVAGFQDHGIGPVLGTSRNTGAGGANMWTSDALRSCLPEGFVLPELPAGTGFTLALRRTLRVGDRLGMPLEDLGVTPNYTHRMTRADVLDNNVDLLARAGALLAERPVRRLVASVDAAAGRPISLTVQAAKLDRIDVYVDGRPRGSFDLAGAELRCELPAVGAGAHTIDLHGFAEGEQVAARRVDFAVA